MVINTESIVGYNNKLKRATPTMRVGLNHEINMINNYVQQARSQSAFFW